MNDPRRLRERPDLARRGIESRSGRYLPHLEEFLGLDGSALALQREAESLRARRNALSEQVGKAKASGQETVARELMAEVSRLKATLKAKEAELEALASRQRESLLNVPNLPHESAPIGKSDADNRELRRSVVRPADYDFKPLDHQSLGERLGIFDPAAAARLSGARFALLWGQGARLERSLISFMLDLHARRHGYIEVWPPYLLRPEILEGTGQLPKFKEDMYRTVSCDEEGSRELYLVSTAEIPLTNLVRERILDGSRLPLRFMAFTPCFRQEAGSYGKDTRGLIRVHQFDKVELVWVTRPEDSIAALEELTRHAEAVLAELEIPYRVIELCTADLPFSACKAYDLELWMPGEGRYREVSSCSHCSDFQARRMSARFRRAAGSTPEFVHTLNGSGVAAGRVFAAILENFQRKDGSVDIPKALRPYFGADELVAQEKPI